MKVSKNINQKLAHVPVQQRVFQYDATIVIEFLAATFMPLAYHLTPSALKTIGAGSEIRKTDLVKPERYGELFLSMYQLYEYYKLFRESRPYTSPVETKYKFSIIIKKLLLPKNGWQFEVKRIGRAQLIYVGPLELRAKVPLETRNLYPIDKPKVETIDVSNHDLTDTTYSEAREPVKPDEVIDPTLIT